MSTFSTESFSAMWHDSPTLYETVREMMLAAVEVDGEVDAPDARPGMVAVIQTFASFLKWNPHIRSVTSRRLFTTDGQMKVLAFITELDAIRRILDHRDNRG